jgi:hypothetical protein
MIMPGQSATGCRTVGTSMNAFAERLASHGLKVTFPDRPESHRLKISATNGVRCEVIVDDDGAACECSVTPARNTTPARIAPLVAQMLGAGYTDPERYAVLHRGVPLAGAVACEMTTRGLCAKMDVIEDHKSFQVFADVIISNPASPERGKVHIGDDGWIYWECYGGEIPGGTGAIADTIAGFLTHPHPITARDYLRRCLRRMSLRRYVRPRGQSRGSL